MDLDFVVLNLLLVSYFLLHFCTAIDTITLNQSMTDGKTLISSGENFVLGFFSPENSANRYVGIWYNKIPGQTVVWVANRDYPITDSSGVLTINNDGNLIIVYGRQRSTIWSSNNPVAAANSSAKLLDTGNLIISQIVQDKGDRILWQSFDYPTDSLLPYMKFGLNQKSGMNWNLTSWKSKSNPAVGDYSYVVDPRGSPQFFVMKGSNAYTRSGPWNGQGPSAAVDSTLRSIFNYSFIYEEDEIYYTYNLYNSSTISRLLLDDTGSLQRLTWIDNNSGWATYWSAPTDRCDVYARCGAYGSCSGYDALLCECLQGFEPKSPREWSLRDGSDGCVRRKQLDCGNGDRFYKLEHVKLPDTSSSRVDPTLNLDECKKQCFSNCSCTAYASADIRGGGSGCLSWYGDLIDLKSFTDVGQDMYIRVSASELDVSINRNSTGSDDSKRIPAIATVTVSLGMFLLVFCGYFLWRKKMKGQAEKQSSNETSVENEIGEGRQGTELSLFEIDTILSATDNFSSENKLGEGGFGPVYKGVIEDGEEIAVKRLSKNSGQGREEFKNEVILIAKLQHRNLVRLCGCCIQGEERMLIYEYMPNKSLDTFIFDRTRRMLLDWRKRFNIILGIARGVLYLHQDSRLKIIHRDLKASNILLDAEMNPKISDFGMARIFGGNQTQANTIRVVGTRGYISPEYAMDGLFSDKSDVFSFGVLLLEIISGRKNSGYYHSDPLLNLIRHIWSMWREGRGLEILDSSMKDSYISSEVLRCIKVGLLCVQENAAERPTMSSVVFMLSNETTMPLPKQPSFSIKDSVNIFQPPYSTGSCSVNEVTVTMVEGR